MWHHNMLFGILCKGISIPFSEIWPGPGTLYIQMLSRKPKGIISLPALPLWVAEWYCFLWPCTSTCVPLFTSWHQQEFLLLRGGVPSSSFFWHLQEWLCFGNRVRWYSGVLSCTLLQRKHVLHFHAWLQRPRDCCLSWPTASWGWLAQGRPSCLCCFLSYIT